VCCFTSASWSYVSGGSPQENRVLKGGCKPSVKQVSYSRTDSCICLNVSFMSLVSVESTSAQHRNVEDVNLHCRRFQWKFPIINPAALLQITLVSSPVILSLSYFFLSGELC